MRKIILFLLLIFGNICPAQWNSDSCKLCLPFNAWSKGNGASDINTGEMPAYPNGSYDATFTDMGSGYGYLSDGYCIFDGSNDHIETTLRPTYSDASKFTWEFKFRYNDNGAYQGLAQQFVDVNNRMQLGINSAHKIALKIEESGDDRDLLSTDTLADGSEYTVHVVKDGATMKIYINKNEVSYDTQETYNLGDFSPAVDIFIGERNDGAGPFADRIYWCAYYDDAFTAARCSTNHVFDNGMSTVATNDGSDLMIIGWKSNPHR